MKLFRIFNRLNPTSHYYHYDAGLAKRLVAILEDGEFQITHDMHMEFHMKDALDCSIYFNSFEFLCRRIFLSFLKPDSASINISANIGGNVLTEGMGKVLDIYNNPNYWLIFVNTHTIT